MAKRQQSDEGEQSPEKKKTSVSIPANVLKELKHEAVNQDIDVSSLIVKIAEEYLKRRKGGR